MTVRTSEAGSKERKLRILTYTTLFPNPAQPRHGIFVEQRLQQLCADFPVIAEVIAPVPWFPFTASRFGLYGAYARAPRTQRRGDLEVLHPRYPVIPRLSWRMGPSLLYRATLGYARRLHAAHRYDLIDAHFFYPDGVAAMRLGQALELPVIITARGNDVSLMPQFAGPRRQILWAARGCAGIVTVCAALRDELVGLGVAAEKIVVLRNGVDLELFAPVDGGPLRQRLGVGTRHMLLSVGHLIERKGNHVTIEALASIPNAVLVLVGDGPEESALRQLARALGVAERVLFVGAVDQAELKHYYAAADALVLASSREGWANVLLESMACGCPVIATRVWGTPEVVADPAAGVLMDERSAPAVVRAYARLFAAYPERTTTRAYAECFDWHDTSRGQYELMCRVRDRY